MASSRLCTTSTSPPHGWPGSRGRLDRQTPDQPRFVAGSVGPTNRTASISLDVNDPGYRAVTFQDLVTAYKGQMVALIDGGVDALIETVFDTLNASALFAAEEAFDQAGQRLPIMVSGTITDAWPDAERADGRSLLGLHEPRPLVLHRFELRPRRHTVDPAPRGLSDAATCGISAHPNAGLPNEMGEYDQGPGRHESGTGASWKKDWSTSSVAAAAPHRTTSAPSLTSCKESTAAIARHLQDDSNMTARPLLSLSGLEPLWVTPETNFVNVGERTNVTGSRKFLRLIKEDRFEEAVEVAREQVEGGAQILDVNMDEGLLDAAACMRRFLNLIAAEPDIARIPIMIDSSKWEVIEAGLQCIRAKGRGQLHQPQGRRAEFLQQARTIRRYGAAVVVMAFDEQGQADNYQRRIDICERAYRLLVDEAGYDPRDIIFDPNIFPVATGMEEHRLQCTGLLPGHRMDPDEPAGHPCQRRGFQRQLPASAATRRSRSHAQRLYHGIRAGMDLGIVNPTMLTVYDDIPADLLERVEDVLLDRRDDATERLIAFAEGPKAKPAPRSRKTMPGGPNPCGNALNTPWSKALQSS